VDLIWNCPDCRRTFNRLPMEYSIQAPSAWLALPEGERQRRGLLTDDFCSIDGKQHFLRGCIELTVHGTAEKFTWGVWVSISQKSRRRIESVFTQKKFHKEPPHPATLVTWIGAYPKPDDIRCQVYIRPGDLRPLVVLQSADYPLAIEQREGITLDRVKQIASQLGHA
jgi:hypothetical protein